MARKSVRTYREGYFAQARKCFRTNPVFSQIKKLLRWECALHVAGAMALFLDSWIREVIAERARILARIGPLPPPPDDRDAARRDAVYRAAAALLEWERATTDVERVLAGLRRELTKETE